MVGGDGTDKGALHTLASRAIRSHPAVTQLGKGRVRQWPAVPETAPPSAHEGDGVSLTRADLDGLLGTEKLEGEPSRKQRSEGRR